MKIGIYPGSFDPIHLGHIKIVNEILKHNLVEKVLIVPTNDYWGKNVVANVKDRINMVKLLCSDRILVDEKNNDTKSTFDLLQIIKKDFINDELFLIIGGDNIEHLHKWINYSKLIEYPFIVVKRDSYDDLYIKKRFLEMNKSNYQLLDIPNIDISSSYIRNNVDNDSRVVNYIDQNVYRYIKDHNLY